MGTWQIDLQKTVNYRSKLGTERGMCALWSVTETGENRRIMSMCLLEDNHLATGKELPINAPQLTTK